VLSFYLSLNTQGPKLKTDMQLPSHSNPSLHSRAGASGGLPQSTIPCFRLIDDELCQVKRLIDEQFSDAREPVKRLLGCANIHGGRMMRAGLVLLSYRVVRDALSEKGLTSQPQEQENVEKKINDSAASTVSRNQDNKRSDTFLIAAIVELIHNAALLHDDVIEGGQKRRGVPTVNNLCGSESAVLLGNFLLSKVFKMCAVLEPDIVNIIARTVVRVCEGGLRQITKKQDWQLSESEYIDIITERSAVLFSSCCLLGGLLAGASETQAQLLAGFGLNTGIAFQINEELADAIGDESKTDKTLGSYVDRNQLTLAVIHLLRTLDEGKRETVIKSYLEPDTRCEKEGLAGMLRRFGSLEYSHTRIQEFVTKALDSLTDLKEGEAKGALIETAKFIGRRMI
jgi:geranylgeranyl pyrophosphate synthase